MVSRIHELCACVVLQHIGFILLLIKFHNRSRYGYSLCIPYFCIQIVCFFFSRTTTTKKCQMSKTYMKNIIVLNAYNTGAHTHEDVDRQPKHTYIFWTCERYIFYILALRFFLSSSSSSVAIGMNSIGDPGEWWRCVCVNIGDWYTNPQII